MSSPQRSIVGACVSLLLALGFMLAPPGAASAFAQTADSSTLVATSALNVRTAPSTDSAIITQLVPGDEFSTFGAVSGEEVLAGNDTWYRTRSGYVYSAFTAPAGDVSVAGVQVGTERRIEVSLSQKVAHAVENGRIVYTALVTVGRPGWETPVGTFSILRRVANETMIGTSIGIPEGSPENYYLEGVLYTQYFTNAGNALHYNYWSPASAFGNTAESRGCVGMTLGDAAFFWDFADIGTPVIISP